MIDEAPSLIVPHPRFRERLFVLDPLAEIAGEWIDPVTGKTIAQLRARLLREGAGPQARPTECSSGPQGPAHVSSARVSACAVAATAAAVRFLKMPAQPSSNTV